MVDASALDERKSESQQSLRSPRAPVGDDAHAIFDRIAQSMEYANAFDVGTVELQKRFEDFDRIDDLKRGATRARKELAPPLGPPVPGTDPRRVAPISSRTWTRFGPRTPRRLRCLKASRPLSAKLSMTPGSTYLPVETCT
jgi:hypothetical protein